MKQSMVQTSATTPSIQPPHPPSSSVKWNSPDKRHQADEAFGNVSVAPSELFSAPRVDEHLDETKLVRLAGRRVIAWAKHNQSLVGLLDLDGHDLAMRNAGASALGERGDVERRHARSRRRINPRADQALQIGLEGEHAAGQADEDQEDRHRQARPAVEEDEELPHHEPTPQDSRQLLHPLSREKAARRRRVG